MANKYIVHGATYCGDGTSPNMATADGGVGAWNNINIFEGTAPPYGSLAAGDTVYIRPKDASGNDMTGTISGPSVSFSYAWTANKPWVGIAVGLTNAKIAVASGTIEQSTGNKGVFVSGLERWYQNP